MQQPIICLLLSRDRDVDRPCPPKVGMKSSVPHGPGRTGPWDLPRIAPHLLDPPEGGGYGH
jgi:hypothetical protein